MLLTRHQTATGPRWALHGHYLSPSLELAHLLEWPRHVMTETLPAVTTSIAADGPLLPPLEPLHEVWACGVTYLRSRDARKAESAVGDVYERVYAAERPEIFFKSVGWRVVGHGAPIRVRRDSTWDVPEPELTLVVNAHGEIVGYCAGNDVSSRSIEGENPLYLPQAKTYAGSCVVGPGIQLASASEMAELPIAIEIRRSGQAVFTGATTTANLNRPLELLVSYLTRELAFPQGVFLMTGTGVVPGDDYSLTQGDRVRISVGALTIENEVQP